MPVYEFKDRGTGEVFEALYISWKDAPQELLNPRTGNVGDRIPSRVGIAVVVDDARAEARALEKKGIVPVEAGMERDFNEARIAREKKEEAARTKVIRDTLDTFF